MSDTGRHAVTLKDKKGENRTFIIEPIDNSRGKGRKKFGDINPATKKVEGDYGDKYVGSIHEDESVITEENGFKNIINIKKGSPYSVIRKILDEE